MARKVIIDCDPGIDDAVALCMALFDPRLDVIAVTATAGNVDAHQASRNVQAIIEHLDPPRWPRVGVALPREDSRGVNARQIHGDDGLGNIGLATSEHHRQHPSDKVIIDAVHNAPGEVTIVALGPLTNIATAMNRDPQLASLASRILITGGSVRGVGNVTATAEFNMFCDPASARAVFQSSLAKTLVPLDVTERIVMNLDFVDELPADSSRAGAFLRKILAYSFRAYRQVRGLEGIHLHDAVSVIAAINPEFFETTVMAADVETSGELTCGATLFDQRVRPEWRPNMEVVTEIDNAAVHDGITQSLRYAGQKTK